MMPHEFEYTLPVLVYDNAHHRLENRTESDPSRLAPECLLHASQVALYYSSMCTKNITMTHVRQILPRNQAMSIDLRRLPNQNAVFTSAQKTSQRFQFTKVANKKWSKHSFKLSGKKQNHAFCQHPSWQEARRRIERTKINISNHITAFQRNLRFVPRGFYACQVRVRRVRCTNQASTHCL